MNEEKVSIIIPAYNGADYIVQTLNAVVNQTYNNIEVIVVNDGSSDNTSDVANKFLSEKGCCYKVIDKKNGGQSSARNMGALNSSGDFITFLDSDDFIQKNYVARLVSALKESNSDFAACPFQNVSSADFEREPGYDHGNKEYSAEELAYSYLHRKITIVAPALLLKRSLLEKLSFDEDCPYDEDGLYVWNLLYSSDKGVYCDTPIYNYRIREGSVMHSLSVEKCHQSILCYERHCMQFVVQRNYSITRLILPNYKLSSLHVLSKNVSYDEFVKEYKRINQKDVKQLVAYKDIKLSIFALLFICSSRLFYQTSKLL